MRNSIVKENIERRGVRVPSEYSADFLELVTVGEKTTRRVATLAVTQSVSAARSWLSSSTAEAHHGGFPVLNKEGEVAGLVTRRALLDPLVSGDRLVSDLILRAPITIFADESLRQAADVMVREQVGRLVVVDRQRPSKLIGIISQSDILSAHSTRLHEHHVKETHLKWIGTDYGQPYRRFLT